MTDIAENQDPGVPVTPLLLSGVTDCHFFRDKGLPCYGFMPFKLTGREASRMHGNDERTSVDNMKDSTRLMYEIVRKLAVE